MEIHSTHIRARDEHPNYQYMDTRTFEGCMSVALTMYSERVAWVLAVVRRTGCMDKKIVSLCLHLPSVLIQVDCLL